MNGKIYYYELACYDGASESGRRIDYYDLSHLPTKTIKAEFEHYIRKHSEQISFSTIRQERTYFKQCCEFLQERKNLPESLMDWEEEKWIQQLKIWMLQKGMALTKKRTGVYGQKRIADAELIYYLKKVIAFLKREDPRPEQEKDIWDLEKLDIPIKKNPIYQTTVLNFTTIKQKSIREEVKRSIYLHLKYEKLETIKREIASMRKFSAYLSEKQPHIQSCAEINRAVIEDYLVYTATDGSTGRSHNSTILMLRNMLKSIGEIYNYPHLEIVLTDMDIPAKVKPEFKFYSDEEMKRLNAHITQLDEQLARCLVIHQMLGSRISDTLTLRCDCLFQIDGQDMINIQQVKTHTFQKPISAELAMLIQKAIEYTKQKYGETEYIFVDDKDANRPLKYKVLEYQVLTLIKREDLRDDEGKLFKFTTHMFRRTYGTKLTEMHLDDWTIAKLLGHKGIGSVKHYRRMSNQTLADETKAIRARQSEILLANLEGWEEEYEQLR